MDFLSIVGTIASVGSIPLSIYLFIKNKENNIDKVKRDIVKVLSHQIGDRRELTTFEIQTVINSKTREAKLSEKKITINHIIEDLVSETISNPLLDKIIKEDIISELRKIYFKGEILNQIDQLGSNEKDDNSNEKYETEIKRIIENRKNLVVGLEQEQKYSQRTSEVFGILVSIIASVLGGMTFFVGKEKYDRVLSKPLYSFLEKNDFYIAIATSIAATLLALIGLIIVTVIKRKKRK